MAKKTAPKISKKQRATNEGKPYVLVLFGSQTGTAEDFGEQLINEMESYGVIGDLKDMEDVEGDVLADEKYVLFVVATYGEGEPTDNAKEMWEYLLKECKDDDKPLPDLRFGVFGLGNKTYEHYNWMGRELNKRLLQLGASAFLPYGEGDDDATLEDDFSEWKKAIWAPLCKELGVEQSPSTFETGSLTRSWKWQVIWEDENAAAEPAPATVRTRFTGKVDPKKRVFDKDHPFLTTATDIAELYQDGSERGCLHANVVLPKGVRYEEGDHIGVYPRNSNALVDSYLHHWSLDGSRVLRLLGNTDKDRGQLIFGPAPLREALATLVDLQDRPRKSTLERFLAYATPEQESALRRFLEKDVYVDEVEHRYMSVLEILSSLPTAPLQVPVQELLQILPPLLPRYYSISSSMRFVSSPPVASVTCARVDLVSPTGRPHAGVASHWLYSLRDAAQPSLAAFIRSSSFRMPSSGRPAIMIGPGTGIAPFMGFLQRRAADRAARNKTDEPGQDVLFTGFRTRDEFIYASQLETWQREGLMTMHVAFSRVDPARKHYVQHDLEAQAEQVWALVDGRKANVYICGDANHMERDVLATLLRIFKERLGGSEQAANTYLEKMNATKQLQKDTWF